MIGNRFGLGKEFEKGFLLLGQLVLSMMGMIIIAPLLADLLAPFFDFVYRVCHIEPSIISASIFANDMGGAPLAVEIAGDARMGLYNGMVVASMMGATVSFSIPYALGAVKKEKQRALMLGLLAGIVTVPIGCVVGGLFCGIGLLPLLLNLLPLIVFAALIALGLLLFPGACVKAFHALGILIRIGITIGLMLGIVQILLGKKLFSGAADGSEAVAICLNAATLMAGAFPLLLILSKLLRRPMRCLGNVMGIGEKATLGFFSTLANNVSTFEMMNEMDDKGVVLNAAFAVSASFILADHLAFTLAYEPTYLLPMTLAKVVAGISAVVFALAVHCKTEKKKGNGVANDAA